MNRKSWWALAVAALLAGAGAVIWFGVRAEPHASARDRLPPSTAEVTWRTLVDTRTVDGQLGYGQSRTATSRLPGTLTYAPAGGTRVSRGQPLFRVDEKPVMLLYGRTPAWRRLAPGVEGHDVRQLEENLRTLGYSGFTVDDVFTGTTATALARWQGASGLERTGTVELGRVVFTPAAVRVTTLEATPGDPLMPGGRVLTYTGTTTVVAVDLDTGDQRLAGRNAAADVELPDGTRAAGHVTGTTTVIEASGPDGKDQQTTIEVSVAIDDPRAASAYVLAAVDVTFTAAERENVLTVPVAALVSLPDREFGVEVVANGATHYVPVRTGLFSEGWVEISGTGIVAGTVVGMPQ